MASHKRGPLNSCVLIRGGLNFCVRDTTLRGGDGGRDGREIKAVWVDGGRQTHSFFRLLDVGACYRACVWMGRVGLGRGVGGSPCLCRGVA